MDPKQQTQADFLAAYRRFSAEKASDGRDWCFAVRSIGDTSPPRIVEVGIPEAAATLVVYAPQRNEEVRPATIQEIRRYRAAA